MARPASQWITGLVIRQPEGTARYSTYLHVAKHTRDRDHAMQFTIGEMADPMLSNSEATTGPDKN